MLLSIIVVSYEVRELLLASLASIFENPPAGDFQVICVDNGSRDGTPEALRQRFPAVRRILNPDNRGWTRGCNLGLAEAEGDFRMFLDPDTRVLPGTLDRLLAFLRAQPAAGCVGPRTLYPDGTLQLTCRNFQGLKFAAYHTLGVHRIFPRHPEIRKYYLHDWDHRGARRVDMVNTSCVLFRREVQEAVGPLDEAFFAHYGDNDWFYRISRTPWEVWFCGDAEIVHHAGGSTRPVLFRQIFIQQRDLLRYFRKHHAASVHPLLHPAVTAGIVARTGFLVASNLFRTRKSLYSHPRGWR